MSYRFTGINTIQNGNVILSGNAFSSALQGGYSCIGSRCPSTCITSQLCLFHQGTLTTNTCFLCAVGQSVSNNQCISQPSTNCGLNRYYNGSMCVCNSQYTEYNGQCYVTCSQNAIIINSQCQCVPGYSYSIAANRCVQQITVTCTGN